MENHVTSCILTRHSKLRLKRHTYLAVQIGIGHQHYRIGTLASLLKNHLFFCLSVYFLVMSRTQLCLYQSKSSLLKMETVSFETTMYIFEVYTCNYLSTLACKRFMCKMNSDQPLLVQLDRQTQDPKFKSSIRSYFQDHSCLHLLALFYFSKVVTST